MSAGPLHAEPFVTRGGERLAFTRIGFGGASLGPWDDSQTRDEALALVETGWSLGIRYFDTAPFYGFGRAERRLGEALAARSRATFLLSSKVGRLLAPGSEEVREFAEDPADWPFDYAYSYDAVMRSYEGSLKRLGVGRIDILYVHDIDARVHGSREIAEARRRELMDQGGWRALDELRSSRAVRAIGVGVNEWEPCAAMLECADPDLFLLAGRYTLLEQEPLEALFPACARRGVGVVIGGPLNAGVMAGGPLYDYAPAPAPVLERVAAIWKVCEAHQAPVVAAALQFAGAHPVVVSILTGAATPAELTQNVEAFTGPASPAALWPALKGERLLHADAPTPAGA